MKEDLEAEIENLREQYEEKKLIEIERMRRKYA